jgi:CheY-like chemotaxis protein
VLASMKPDIIVLDVMLPDADGRELLAKLKQNPKFNLIPVMLWSARPREADVDLDELGAEVFLQKGPTDTLPAELERVLMRISERIPIK